ADTVRRLSIGIAASLLVALGVQIWWGLSGANSDDQQSMQLALAWAEIQSQQDGQLVAADMAIGELAGENLAGASNDGTSFSEELETLEAAESIVVPNWMLAAIAEPAGTDNPPAETN